MPTKSMFCQSREYLELVHPPRLEGVNQSTEIWQILREVRLTLQNNGSCVNENTSSETPDMVLVAVRCNKRKVMHSGAHIQPLHLFNVMPLILISKQVYVSKMKKKEKKWKVEALVRDESQSLHGRDHGRSYYQECPHRKMQMNKR